MTMAKYLSPEEILEDKETKDKLSRWVSPSIRAGFSLNVVNKYAENNFKDKNIKILDVGTASGSFTKELSDAGYNNLYGLDIDDYVQPENKKLLNDFKKADLSYDKIPYSDDFFDVITAWCVVPHLENPHNFIREAHRVLRRGRLLMITLINITSPSHRKYFSKHGDFPGFHERNNHIALFTNAIFKKTVLKYFNLIGKEYLTSPSVFTRGLKGKFRNIFYKIISKNKWLKSKIDERWGSKVAYILRKP
jgi:2-polyprenyl-3-methyl-5-hydroxy-6-metoxy-1,4-benzoquinol methylase